MERTQSTGTERCGDDDPQTRAELLDRAAAYVETVDLDLDVGALDWDVSERAREALGEEW